MTLPACDRIIELAEKATPGPWSTEQNIKLRLDTDVCARGGEDFIADCGMLNGLSAKVSCFNADFIAESRTLAPKIALALNEAVRAIEEAEHAVGCDGECTLFIGGPAEGCTCWKQTALARINELLK